MSSSDERARRFLYRFAVAVGSGILLLLTATWAFDPYGQLGAPICRAGIKVESDTSRMLIVLARKPREILVGNSRVARGFEGEDARALLGTDVANLGLPGALFEDADGVARMAIDRSSIDRLWLAVDFGMFVRDQPTRRRFSAPPDWLPSTIAIWWYGLFHPQAGQDAVRSGRPWRACRSPHWDRSGFLTPAGREALDESSSWANLQWRAAGIRREMTRARGGLDAHPAAYRLELARLERLIEDVSNRGIEMILVINPSHPSYFDAVRAAGLGDMETQWRTDLSRLAAGRSKVIQIQPDLPETCTRSVHEPCPFYDATHYRPAVGRTILEAGVGEQNGQGLSSPQ